MLCSDCSKDIRPIVAFDIDGTLGDYHGQLIEFTEMYVGHPARMDERPYDGTMNFGDWVMEAFDIPSRKEYRDIKLAFRQGGTKRWMPKYQDMIDCVWLARDLDCEIWLTTTRPYLRLDSVDPDTREWLRRHDVPFNHLMYDDHKYQILPELVDLKRVVLIVDDLLEQVHEATCVWDANMQKSPAILRRCQYNEGCRWDGPEVRDGSQLEEIIISRIERWNDKYARSQGSLGRRQSDTRSKRPTGGWATHGREDQ